MTFEIGSLDVTYSSDGAPMPGVRSLNKDTSLSGIEGQDGLRNSFSSTTPEPSVAGLRDRLLREARQERIRCLQVARASERWRADEGGSSLSVTTSDSATQTDPIVISEIGSAPCGLALDSSIVDVWSQSDEEAQKDAIRTIKMLSQKKSDTTISDRRIAELEEMLRSERARAQDLEVRVVQEKQAREAIQQQVLTLEAEMDGKESTLQAQQRVLERTNDMQLVPHNLRAQSPLPPNGRLDLTLPSTLASQNRHVLGRSKSPLSRTLPQCHAVVEEANLLAARRQLQERDQNLEVKDQQISQLLRELRQSSDTSPTNFDRGLYNAPKSTSNLSFGNWR
mmetsp:Transcript_78633/g.122711  ORF Transcript_78633/g.122711 Transcript_78633/m.122711 type:complete len:338 (+) Transcript_78633:89-1102(+)